MQAQVIHKEVNGIGLRNVIEQLTRLDPKTNEVLPMLAVSWKRTEPTVWHFDLRHGSTPRKERTAGLLVRVLSSDKPD